MLQKMNKTFKQTAFVFQGGGALGAYQAGAYEALSEAGYEPDWLAGISIGAINSAIIAGNEPRDRLPRLRHFWEQVTSTFRWPAPQFGDELRHIFNSTSAVSSAVVGQPGFFGPRLIPPCMHADGTPAALSFYDTAPLKRTLEDIVDFDRINNGPTRLSLGAVNIRLGNFVYFDSREQVITPAHVMASAALPPGFPPVEIDGECYWDGGIVSNTPLAHVLDTGLDKDTLVFQVDLFNCRGELPQNLLDVEARQKHITYSSRTRLNTDNFREKHMLRRAILDLLDQLPPEARRNKNIRNLNLAGAEREIAIVHLIYRRAPYEGQAVDYEFSRASMNDHWQAGLRDGRQTTECPCWLDTPMDNGGVQVFDLTQPDMKKEAQHAS